MLVTFSCDAYENITFFGEVAQQLLIMMGHSGAVPSAILAKEVPFALQKLLLALEDLPQLPTPKDDESVVSLHKRAIPIIALLKAADKKQCDVMITG